MGRLDVGHPGFMERYWVLIYRRRVWVGDTYILDRASMVEVELALRRDVQTQWGAKEAKHSAEYKKLVGHRLAETSNCCCEIYTRRGR